VNNNIGSKISQSSEISLDTVSGITFPFRQ